MSFCVIIGEIVNSKSILITSLFRDFMKRLLLHVCCAPCSTVAIERMMKEYDVTLFFSNSNISPENEYSIRLGEARKIARAYGLALVEDPYDHQAWLKATEGLWGEPEKGRRCPVCFRFNLERTGEFSAAHSFDHFTTTLTISPHKDSTTIFRIGQDLAGFLPVDFKKKGGFSESISLSKRHGLIRQDYCGCEFSRRKMNDQGMRSMASPSE